MSEESGAEAGSDQRFLPYHEPGVVDILILVSFFTFLWLAEYISTKFIRAGLIGLIAVGIIYGQPLANILQHDWQETFLYLGYIGLILIIFEGGLTARLDLLRANIGLSTAGAATGVTFIIGAALSATSLGTTFAVIAGASKTVDLSQTRVGAVLVSAAVIDDVTGLVMSSVIHDLGDISSGGESLGWLIGRPILASAAMAILTPLLSKFALAPFFRKFLERRFANTYLFTAPTCGAGTSVLFGAFLAGSFLSYLPSKHPEGPFVVLDREEGERNKDKSPTFIHTFEYYCLEFQKFVLEPLFFASIGFAIPFLDLWTGSAIWHDVVYTLLMLTKFIVGIWIPIWASFTKPSAQPAGEISGSRMENAVSGDEEDPSAAAQTAGRAAQLKAAISPGLLLGMAMVARGEISLLIVEIGYNNTPYVSRAGFLTAIWATLLNTILGPIAVGLLVKRNGEAIGKGDWGLVKGPNQEMEESRNGGA
ncbi:Uu.00g074140.m01.CDS01 [Anthostomella pinea]|uniref:Uu.00g074140.m01.CDS01 n=1 Tax=Anthostomella pinea TaxID=933095 RepID=A0AAI8VW54_9PEZI|nr:Uu.00g074140.m01.CDS01 [Anthostomella pinea]